MEIWECCGMPLFFLPIRETGAGKQDRLAVIIIYWTCCRIIVDLSKKLLYYSN